MQKNFRLVFGLLTTLALAFSTSVQAGWGSYGSNGGSWGSHGGNASWGGSGSSGGGSSGGSWGGGSSGGGSFSHWSRPGLLHRVFHHHRSWGSHGGQGSWGSSGGGSTGGGSTGGGSWGGGSSGGGVYQSGYGSSGGSHGGSTGGGTMYSPVVPDSSNPAAPAPLPEQKKAALKVTVPEDALVYVNGILTKSTGTSRTYVSRGLLDGFQYTYEVRAEMIRDGKKLEETKIVSLKVGEDLELAFSSLQPVQSKETSLTLNVPAEAKVLLGGNPTNGSGAVRTFTTSKLSGDKAWTNYVVQVSVERSGRTLTQEKTIRLSPGDHQTLTFDFDREQVAAR